MAYKQQMEQFRKDIRRSQLDEIFQSRRIKLLTDQANSMDMEEPHYLKKSELETHELISLAKFSQTLAGIQIINQANYGDNLVKYLSSEFLGTNEQTYATYILCNLSYSSKTAPNNALLTAVLTLLEEVSDQNVADNLLCIIGNTIHDYQQTKQHLIAENLLVSRLIAIISRFQDPCMSLCNAVSNCILQMLNRANSEKSFLKLRQLLLRFLRMTLTQQTLAVIKQSTYSLSLLTNMFPSDLVETIIKGKVLQRMAELYKTSSELCFVSFLIKIANSILKELTGNTFSLLLLPLLHYVSSNNFLNLKPSGMTAHALTAETYKLINSALEFGKLKVEDFVGSEMGKRMLTVFEIEDDQDLRRQLVFVFTHVCLSIQDESVRLAIERAFLRTRELDHKNFELAGHIDQLLFLFQH